MKHDEIDLPEDWQRVLFFLKFIGTFSFSCLEEQVKNRPIRLLLLLELSYSDYNLIDGRLVIMCKRSESENDKKCPLGVPVRLTVGRWFQNTYKLGLTLHTVNLAG